MKKLLENVILLLITAILVLGIYNYIKSIEEPKEEDPIVDVLPDDEEPGENETPGTDVEPGEDEETSVELLTFSVFYCDELKSFSFEEGMTWEDFINSDYDVPLETGDVWSIDSGIVKPIGIAFLVYYANNGDSAVQDTDLIRANYTYCVY